MFNEGVYVETVNTFIAAFAEISFQAIKGIYSIKEDKKPIFKEGYERLSPIWGFLALKTGMIENLRFFGNYTFGWNKDDSTTRNYSSDHGMDGISKLVKILFPSTGGQLTTVANNSSNLGTHMTPEIIAEFLNQFQAIRKDKNHKCELNKLSEVTPKPNWKEIANKIKKDTDFNSNKEQNQEKVIEYFGLLLKECFENEMKGLYPAHTTEHIILAFLWSHFNTKKDIIEMYQGLDTEYINIELIPKIPEDLLHWGDIKNSKNETDLSKKNLEEAIQIAYGMSYFNNPTPYVLGESLISNQTAHFYDRSQFAEGADLAQRKKGELDSDGYADCVEVSQRHLFNFILFDGEKFSLDTLEKTLKEKQEWKPNSAFLNMKEWFYGEQQPTKDKANAGDIQTRSAWNGVVGDLNHNCILCHGLQGEAEKFYKVYYHSKLPTASKKADKKNELRTADNSNELHPGFINRLNVIEHVLGVRLEKFGTREEKEEIEKSTEVLIKANQNAEVSSEYKNAYKNYVTTKMNIFMRIGNKEAYNFSVQNFEIGENKGLDGGHPYDLFDSTMIIEGEKDEKSFTFTIKSLPYHGVTEFNSKQEEQKKFEIHTNFKNTLLGSYLKQSNDQFYNLYANTLLNDYDKTREFLEKLIKHKDFNSQTHFSLSQCLLAQIGLEDAHAAKESVKVLNKILDLYPS